MRRYAFALTFLGLFTLILILLLSAPKIITNSEELKNLQANQKVQVTGKVIQEKYGRYENILTLDNEIQITCKDCPSYHNKIISTIGILETYTGKPRIKALEITPVYE